jgi:hypothetical protein
MATDPDPAYEHRHDEKLDYRSEGTGADPETVVREERVDNDDKALPTDNRTVLLLSIVAFGLSLLAVVFSYGVELEWLGVLLGIIATIIGVIATVSAYGDQRTGIVTPLLATILALVVTILCFTDMSDVDPDDVDNTVLTPEVDTLGDEATRLDPEVDPQ